MREEAGFLSAIRQTPADETARLVYADWLDEQDDPSCKPKADFIRLEARMAAAPRESLNRIRWLGHLKMLAAGLDPGWLAAVSHPKLEACRLQFRFECPKQWAALQPTADPKARFCESCQQSVHYCDTLREAQDHAARGDCVAVTLALVRRPNDLHPPGTPVSFTADQLERLGTPTTLGIAVGSIPDPEFRPPLFISRWVPEPQPDGRNTVRPNRRSNRKRSRNRHRSIEREDWEEPE